MTTPFRLGLMLPRRIQEFEVGRGESRSWSSKRRIANRRGLTTPHAPGYRRTLFEWGWRKALAWAKKANAQSSSTRQNNWMRGTSLAGPEIRHRGPQSFCTLNQWSWNRMTIMTIASSSSSTRLPQNQLKSPAMGPHSASIGAARRHGTTPRKQCNVSHGGRLLGVGPSTFAR